METRGLDFLKDAAAVSTASYFPGVIMHVFITNNKEEHSSFEILRNFFILPSNWAMDYNIKWRGMHLWIT